MDRDDEDRAERRHELDSQLASIKFAIDANSQEMAKYKGVVGGISLAVSMLWAGFAFFKDSLVEWLHK